MKKIILFLALCFSITYSFGQRALNQELKLVDGLYLNINEFKKDAPPVYGESMRLSGRIIRNLNVTRLKIYIKKVILGQAFKTLSGDLPSKAFHTLEFLRTVLAGL